jgi:hypothetical protein
MQNNTWFQIIVKDPGGLSGLSVIEFISPIVRKMRLKFAIVTDLSGAIAELKDSEGQVLSCSDLMRRLVEVTQFDWAFLFMYKSRPSLEEAEISDARAALQKADITVRLADDEYFYIYTRDQEVVDDLMKSYPGAEFKVCKASDLDIPA